MPLKIIVPQSVLTADKRELRKVLRQAGQELVAITRKLITQASRSGVKRGPHQASAPGEPPANRSGRLAKALKLSVRGNAVTVTDTAPYATALEAGGKATRKKSGRDEKGRDRTNWVLLPRPYLSTALDEVGPEFGERMGKAIENNIKFQDTK